MRHGPSPSPEQTKLIEDLGGPTAVIQIINTHFKLTGTGEEMRPQAVSMWKKRGIPFAYRAPLAIAAREKGIGVPRGFLNESAA